MKKLFEKSEITVAIIWIVIYTVGIGNLRTLGDDSPVLMLGLLVLSLLIILFVRMTDAVAYYGLKGWISDNKAMLWLIPLYIVSSTNLWAGISPNYPMPGLLYASVMMACVGFVEEMIFRGFLFKAMLKDSKAITAVVVSSVTFGMGHIVNLFIGQELAETLIQIVFAVAIGFIFTMVFYKGGSLWPCILAHSFIDVASLFSAEKSPELRQATYIVVLALAVFYCLYLAKRVKTAQINMTIRQ